MPMAITSWMKVKKRSLLSKFIYQFKDLMIIILLVAAALSVITEGMHGLTDACIILAVVVLNAAFGVYQEGQAEAAIEAFKTCLVLWLVCVVMGMSLN